MAEDEEKPNATESKPIVQVVATPETRIAKFCNMVLFNKMDNGNLILSFVYAEPTEKGALEEPGKINDATLIERIIIEPKHAENIIKALQENLPKKEEN